MSNHHKSYKSPKKDYPNDNLYRLQINPRRKFIEDESKITISDGMYYVGGLSGRVERPTMDTLLQQGLQKNHTLVDIGCGCLRIGKSIIEYLNSGQYYGMDGEQNLLDIGRKYVGNTTKKFQLQQSWEFEFEKFGQESFDFMICQGVICHMPLNEISKLFDKVKPFLAPGSKFLVSYIPKRLTKPRRGVFFQSYQELEKLLKDKGYNCKKVPYKHPRGLEMILATI